MESLIDEFLTAVYKKVPLVSIAQTGPQNSLVGKGSTSLGEEVWIDPLRVGSSIRDFLLKHSHSGNPMPAQNVNYSALAE